MAIDTDFLLDRWRLKRQLTFWRLAAVGLFMAAAIAIIGRSAIWPVGAHVARIEIDGVIESDRDRDAAFVRLAEDSQAKALIVFIDSPGGTVVGGESLYSNLRTIAKHKPVVAVMGDVATSAAYMAALGSDRIFAREGTVTGSIGVILQTADVTGLLDRIGIKPETIKSSSLKAQPNPFETFTPEAREATRKVVLDIYEGFVKLVQERRGLSRDQLTRIADGRVFSGGQALANGLIDELGGTEEARAWLRSAHNIDPDLPLRSIEIETPEDRLADVVGGLFKKLVFYERLNLDGMVSLWQAGQ
jgi:protease IV